MRLALFLTLTALAGACSGNDKPKQEADKQPIRLDAGVASQHAAVGPVGDPSGMHIDDGGDSRVTARPAGNRAARDIEITLRSSPPGARVSVDGTPLGNTPAFCNCQADGREHEFLFQMPGHSIARYRFVPVTSGVIHATLERIAEETDAGVPPPEVVPPQQPIQPPPSQPTGEQFPSGIYRPVDVNGQRMWAPETAPPVDAGASDPLPPASGPQP